MQEKTTNMGLESLSDIYLFHKNLKILDAKNGDFCNIFGKRLVKTGIIFILSTMYGTSV
jgi:hypothetical protein